MATMESLAIREEKARERIAKATKQLSVQLGKKVPSLERAKPRDPRARGAQLSEDIADVLEGLLTVVVEVNEEHEAALVAASAPSDDGDKVSDDGDNNAATSGDDPAQPSKEPIKRSATKRN